MDQTRRGFLRFLGVACVGMAAAPAMAVTAPSPASPMTLDEACRWLMENDGTFVNETFTWLGDDGWSRTRLTGQWWVKDKGGRVVASGWHDWSSPVSSEAVADALSKVGNKIIDDGINRLMLTLAA